MNYSCQEEYDYYNSGAAEAEAQQQYEYDKYLTELSESSPYLFALEIAGNLFASNDFKKSGLTFPEYLSELKMQLLKPKETNTNNEIELPF